ncbi:MAG: hypothetical protein HYX26_03295 [Acidobacteriales bacterium]|nr:hypothetical protein [Terriglobales bacterium]
MGIFPKMQKQVLRPQRAQPQNDAFTCIGHGLDEYSCLKAGIADARRRRFLSGVEFEVNCAEMFPDKLSQYQEAARVYQAGQQADRSVELGVSTSIGIIYITIRESEQRALNAHDWVIVSLGIISVLIFWRLRRGAITPKRMKDVSATSFVISGVIAIAWTINILRADAVRQDMTWIALIEMFMFASLGVYTWRNALRIAESPRAGLEEYGAVRAEVERAEIQGRRGADAVTRNFLQVERLWCVRPIDEFACLIRLSPQKDQATMERVAVVPVTNVAIREKLIELGGAKAVPLIQAKLGWPAVASK